MRMRFTWLVAILVLLAIGFLMACNAKYSASSNGLVVLPSYGELVMQSFSINLENGGITQINNVNGPVIEGVPTQVILDPTGNYAYVIVYQSQAYLPSTTGIATFPVASDGKLAPETTASMNPTTPPPVSVQCVPSSGAPQTISVAVTSTAVVPQQMAIDSAGKYIFVADAATSGQTEPYQCNGVSTTSTVPVPGTVSVFSVNNGALTEVPGSPFSLPALTGPSTSSAAALGVTPTIYPPQYAYCSASTPPTTENLYVVDSANYLIFNYSVNTSTGALTLVPATNGAPGLGTGSVPMGVAVDPCNRFVYVANSAGATGNSVSAYTICSADSINTDCAIVDFSLLPVSGSPFAISPGDAPGPIAVDPDGNYVYVVDTGSNQVSAFKISASSGALSLFGTYAAGLGANSISIRSDDTWVFVANFNANTVSQYGIVSSTGALTPQSPFFTLNNPTGVAVK
jgi:6-phosphogluconolactonase (cycloisomerase 2 family)